jgi:phosphopentomutase
MILAADHGNDPTTPSTDHSREAVPLLVIGPGIDPVDLGTRPTFADVGATVAEYFGVPAETGTSFLQDVAPWMTE